MQSDDFGHEQQSYRAIPLGQNTTIKVKENEISAQGKGIASPTSDATDSSDYYIKYS